MCMHVSDLYAIITFQHQTYITSLQQHYLKLLLETRATEAQTSLNPHM